VGKQLPGVWGSCPVALLLLPCPAVALLLQVHCAAALPGGGCGAEAVGQRGRGSREQIREQQGPQNPYLQPVCD
ncbi:hypothetical protein V8C86DRAFT_2464829, partial [Haematococcus lacustris]